MRSPDGLEGLSRSSPATSTGARRVGNRDFDDAQAHLHALERCLEHGAPTLSAGELEQLARMARHLPGVLAAAIARDCRGARRWSATMTAQAASRELHELAVLAREIALATTVCVPTDHDLTVTAAAVARHGEGG